jgi:phosphatidylglycerophosphate synthase
MGKSLFMKKETDFRQFQKPVEGVLTAFLARPFSRKITAQIADVRWVTPNHLTCYSLILGLTGCLIWLNGTWFSAVIGTIIFHFGYILDCSDGELARYRGTVSKFGEALDPIFDRILEFALIICATFLTVHDTSDFYWYYVGSWAVSVNFLFEYIDLWLNRLFAADGRFEKKKRFIFISPSLNLSYRELVLYFLPLTVCFGMPHVGLGVIAIGGTLAFPIQLFRLWRRTQ